MRSNMAANAVSSKTMRALDAMAVSSGVPALDLMENAGSAIFKKAKEVVGACARNKSILIFCGKGNNGGDGLVAARKLSQDGFNTDVYIVGKKEAVKNEAGVNLKLFSETKLVQELLCEEDLKQIKTVSSYSLIIDALTGTGFHGPAKGILKKVINAINSSGLPVIAVDVPSGLNADTGRPEPVAVKASLTLSFAFPKKGFYMENGPSYTGNVEVINIGFTKSLLESAIKLERGI